MTPAIRITNGDNRPLRSEGDYILYWMIANRRVSWNFSLERALEWATDLRKPLIILEALRCDYPWASDRLHQFIIEGMIDNARALRTKNVFYYPYIEPAPGHGKGLLKALSEKACVVVTDDFPCFFIPDMLRAASSQIAVKLEKVDSNGLLPMRATERVFKTAYSFRRYLQKSLPEHLTNATPADSFEGRNLPILNNLPEDITKRWPAAKPDGFSGQQLQGIPIDHAVSPVPVRGGSRSAESVLQSFLTRRLGNYEARNEPEREVSSGLSPHLHFGHVSAHEVFAAIAAAEDWSLSRLSTLATGQKKGWWGMSEPAEAFLDELVTWRELGYNMCTHVPEYDRYQSLPDWARETLAQHASDPRQYDYATEDFEQAQTHDPLWNAAQTQLLREGRIHNYLRMLWGKKILEWSPRPEDALQTMIHLNNKYAVDGRNPNSYSGIFWILGRYDRAWGPERPIFGKVRYMSSKNTARKFRVKNYIRQYSDSGSR